MDSKIDKDDSYAFRRDIFKHIWNTAIEMDEPNSTRPKIIKTARLESFTNESDQKKKQKIKNLRAVCKKLLDFCDRQDDADLYSDKLIFEEDQNNIVPTGSLKRRRSPIAKNSTPKPMQEISKNTSPLRRKMNELIELNLNKTPENNTIKKKKDIIRRKKICNNLQINKQ